MRMQPSLLEESPTSDIPITSRCYLAGFFDGEGSINLYRNQNDAWGLQVQISQVCKAPLIILQGSYGGSLTKVDRRHEYPHRRIQWLWGVTASRAVRFLEAVLPYLVVKEAEARLALEFYERYSATRKGDGRKGLLGQEYYNRLQALRQNKEVDS